MHAVLDAFNRMDIVSYLVSAHNNITSKKENPNIVTLHLCVAHLMKNITSDINNHFKAQSKSNKLIKEIIASLFLEKKL